MGPTVTRSVQDSLAVSFFENQLYMGQTLSIDILSSESAKVKNLNLLSDIKCVSS